MLRLCLERVRCWWSFKFFEPILYAPMFLDYFLYGDLRHYIAQCYYLLDGLEVGVYVVVSICTVLVLLWLVLLATNCGCTFFYVFIIWHCVLICLVSFVGSIDICYLIVVSLEVARVYHSFIWTHLDFRVYN